VSKEVKSNVIDFEEVAERVKVPIRIGKNGKRMLMPTRIAEGICFKMMMRCFACSYEETPITSKKIHAWFLTKPSNPALGSKGV
jgi:hypothetical protein